MWHVFASERIAYGRAWKHVQSKLDSQNVPFQLHVSETAAHHDALVEDAVRNGATHFIPAGGDGAAQLLVNALMQKAWATPPTIALLPLGSGCDFARSFGLNDVAIEFTHLLRLDAKESSETQTTEMHTREVDLGVAKGEWGTRYFVNVASIGLTAAVVRRAVGLSWLGALRYIAAFWIVLPTYGRREFHLQSDEQELRSSSILGVVANGRFFGGGFHVAPKAKLDDAMFELLIASASRVQLVSVLYRLWRGTHLRSSYVTTDQIPRSSVVCDPPAEVEADGEYLGKTPVEFSLKPKAIRIICPRKHEGEP